MRANPQTWVINSRSYFFFFFFFFFFLFFISTTTKRHRVYTRNVQRSWGVYLIDFFFPLGHHEEKIPKKKFNFFSCCASFCVVPKSSLVVIAKLMKNTHTPHSATQAANRFVYEYLIFWSRPAFLPVFFSLLLSFPLSLSSLGFCMTSQKKAFFFKPYPWSVHSTPNFFFFRGESHTHNTHTFVGF